MRLNKSHFIGAAALVGGVLLSSSAMAAAASYACVATTVVDDAGIAGCLTAAGADGTCTLSGTCETAGFIIMNTPNQTLQGPATIHRAAGTVIGLRALSSGSTIQNLRIISDGGNGISNNPTAGTLFDQPDDIKILNNYIASTSLQVNARAIQQAQSNAAPFNDVDRRNGVIPAGIATNWLIQGNELHGRAEDQPALLMGGAQNRIINNEIWATQNGVNFQNNLTVANVPVAYGNYFAFNKVHVTLNVRAAAQNAVRGATVATFFLNAAQDVPGARSSDNVLEHNCFDIVDRLATPTRLLAIGFTIQVSERDRVEKNNVTLGNGVLEPNQTDDRLTNHSNSRDSVTAKNDVRGEQFDGVLQFDSVAIPAPASNNLADHNDYGPPLDPTYAPFLGYSENQDCTAPNLFIREKAAVGGYFYFPATAACGIVVAGNKLDMFTQHPGDLAQAHDCYQGLGFAGSVTLGFAGGNVDPSRPDVSMLNNGGLQAQSLNDLSGLVDNNDVNELGHVVDSIDVQLEQNFYEPIHASAAPNDGVRRMGIRTR